MWLIRIRLPRPQLRRIPPGPVDDVFNWISWLTDSVFPAALVIAALLVILAAVLALVVALFLPLILFVLEIPIVLAGIFFFGRPCAVEAWPEDNEHVKRTWRVRGWSAAKRAVDEVARELQQGVEAAPDEKLLA